jgi:hypothetical protein
MKNQSIEKTLSLIFLFSLLLGVAGCEIVGGIFKAGMGVGIFLVVAVVVVIVFLMNKIGGRK